MAVESTEHTVPRLQRALVATAPGVLTIKRVSVPRLGPGEVLVRIIAVALNPSDHKFLDQTTSIGTISGTDFSGVVVQLGPGIERGGGKDDSDYDALQLGDRVLGPAFGSQTGNGAFAQYTPVLAKLCIRLPDHLDFAAGASLPTALYTMGFVFRSLGIELPTHLDVDNDAAAAASRFRDESSDTKEGSNGTGRSRGFVLVHGGATATGTVALQLLREAGYTPIATCSPANFALVRDRGAAAAYDYASPTVRDDIREWTGGHLSLALDCVGTPASTVLCYGAIGDAGGRYATLEPYATHLAVRRREVKPDWILAWTLFGKELKLPDAYYRPAIPEDLSYGQAWAVQVERLLAAGKLRAHPLDVSTDGLSAVVAGLDLLRKHQVRGKKLAALI
ncbi:GroES-like protein [Nemania sp. FL0916]|nr:GroES-like protein [Nemania sp. FL0916]